MNNFHQPRHAHKRRSAHQYHPVRPGSLDVLDPHAHEALEVVESEELEKALRMVEKRRGDLAGPNVTKGERAPTFPHAGRVPRRAPGDSGSKKGFFVGRRRWRPT